MQPAGSQPKIDGVCALAQPEGCFLHRNGFLVAETQWPRDAPWRSSYRTCRSGRDCLPVRIGYSPDVLACRRNGRDGRLLSGGRRSRRSATAWFGAVLFLFGSGGTHELLISPVWSELVKELSRQKRLQAADAISPAPSLKPLTGRTCSGWTAGPVERRWREIGNGSTVRQCPDLVIVILTSTHSPYTSLD